MNEISERVGLVERSMKDRVAYIIRHGIAVGWPAERITANILAAMREPTDEMCKAAMMTIVHENKGVEYGPYLGWQAMIDALLKD